jgi:hypothetical protein
VETQRRKIEELKEEIDAKMLAPLPKDVENAIAEQDQSIMKLKGMIQRYSKSDETKQTEIETQRQEIRRLSALITDQQVAVQGAPIEKLARLEHEVSELQSQLVNSSTSRQLEAKCEKLTAMLERSNRLYSDLNGRYQMILGQVSQNTRKLSLSVPQCAEFVQAGVARKGKAKSATSGGNAVLGSLRQTLLQYFLTELAEQEHLVPVILDLVGCSPDQIQAAVRNVRSNQQIVNRVGGVFSFFS